MKWIVKTYWGPALWLAQKRERKHIKEMLRPVKILNVKQPKD